jgi:hypothetical protein
VDGYGRLLAEKVSAYSQAVPVRADEKTIEKA